MTPARSEPLRSSWYGNWRSDMSFTKDVKQEIAHNEFSPCCQRAQLSALIQLCSTLSISNMGLTLLIKTENAAVAKYILKLLKDQYDVETTLSVIRKMNLKKNYVYQVRVLEKVQDILEDLGLYSARGYLEVPLLKIVNKDCCARAYLGGAFMASGNVNAPETTSYHLEIAVNTMEHASYVVRLMERFSFPAKIIQRRKQYVVYIKQAEKIADFLRCTGAVESLMRFEDVRISRDYMNSLARINNIDVANEMKSQAAAVKQIEDIEILRNSKQYTRLDPKLKVVCEARLANPEASLIELCEYLEEADIEVISKSGMRHRLNKIHELAEEVKAK